MGLGHPIQGKRQADGVIPGTVPAVDETGSESEDPGPDAVVDLESEVPLTDQLAAILRARIRAGMTGRMPSENELVRQHGVSRVTVRRALRALESEGLIHPARGRGWFVSRQG